MAKITVVGSFVMDNVAKMKEFPQAGETVLGDNIELFPGGKGINQCIAAARLGGDVEMCGMLGKDSNGEIFLDILKSEGVVSRYVFLCDRPTAVAQVQINQNGQNRICVIPSANFAFGLKEVEIIDDALKHTELLVLQLELRLEAVKEIIRRAKSYGVKILLNPAPAVKLEREILEATDYLTPNESELAVLTDLPTDTDEGVKKAAQKLLAWGVKTVVATLGERGALLADGEDIRIIPGYKVKALDTVAAGDSFNGALAVAITEGRDLEEAVRYANATGALTIQKSGAIPSIPTREQVDKFIHSQKTNR